MGVEPEESLFPTMSSSRCSNAGSRQGLREFSTSESKRALQENFLVQTDCRSRCCSPTGEKR